jgi:putative ABC transport system permease protein
MIELLRRLKAAFRPEAIHSEIAEERDFHIEMATADLIRRGIDPEQARKTARARFGSPMRMHEAGFDERGGGIFEDVLHDTRIAFRMLRKTPGKTAALVITVALAIGVDTAVFSVMKAVVLDPLPFSDSQRLVTIHQLSKGELEGVSYPNFEDWRAAARSFEGLAVYAPTNAIFTSDDHAQRLYGAVVSAGLFPLLRVTPLRGRLFTEAEDRRGAGLPLIITDALWRSQFQAREDVLGQTMTLDGANYRIVGIVPAATAFPIHTDPVSYWTTVSIDADPSPWGGSVRKSRGYPRYEAALARLKPGQTLAQAQSEMNVIAAGIAKQHPAVNLREGVRLAPAAEDVVGKIRPLIGTLYGAVFCLLAAGCANAATLLLVGAVARRREFALRTALGARAGRLIRQLMVESLAVAAMGGALGTLLAWTLVSAAAQIAPADTPRLASIHPNGTMLLYAIGLSLATGLLFGLAPALTALNPNPGDALKDGARSTGARHKGPGRTLIALQIALGMMLGCAAAVLTGSFWRILHTPRGFESHGVLTASLSLPPKAYPQGSEKVSQFYEGLLEDVRRLPGVESASAAESLPLSGQNNSTEVEVVGVQTANKASADLRFVEPAYFKTLRIPLREGRMFDARDSRKNDPVVLVNRAFAAKFLGGREALDAKLKLGWGGDAPKTVIGIVGDVRHNALGRESLPEVYVPMAQFPVSDMALVIRVSGEPASMAQPLRNLVRERDPLVPVEALRTLDQYLLLSAAPQRFLMWVLGGFALSVILLGAIGLYGALSYSTLCRSQEFGVRIALGSSAWGVMRLVIREGMAVAAAGLAMGLALTIAASRFLNEWLYETSPLDRTSLACAAATLTLVAAAACWIPARRATRVDPVTSLRGN